MATAYIQIQVTIPNIDGLARDEVVNTFHYISPGGVESTGVTGVVEQFYNTAVEPQTHSIAYYLGNQLDRTNNVTVKYYDKTAHLNGSASGPPFEVDTFLLGASSATADQPNQTCGVLSYYDALDPDSTTKGDHRGRIYLGPLNSSGIQEGGSANSILSSVFVTDATAAMQTLWSALGALSGSYELATWSRKDAAMRPAIGCFMIDKVDTQRRRAYPATSRTTLTF
jgi:hypothetical protein